MAMNTKTSSRYDNIICKVLIQSGSPSVYQLTPQKKNIGTLTRMTLGEKCLNKINKTILLVGETGSGKSTLINALVNYAMGVQWEDNVWFDIVAEGKKSQTESQTPDVIMYEIFGFEDETLPYSLTIIDTPGFGSTSGIEQDVHTGQRLFDLFRSEDGVHEINVVGLVLKATECRLSDRQSYIFNSVVSLFGKDIEKNIVALLTHSNGITPRNALEALKAANVKFATNEKNQPVRFLFDNCLNEDRTEDTEERQHAYKITMNGMSQFTAFLEKTPPQQLEVTVDVLKERIRLTACIQNLEDKIELTELKQKEIQQTREGLNKYELEMKSNENFTVEVDEVYKETKRIDSGMWGLFLYNAATCCTICEENCHYPGCTVAWFPKACQVMSGSRCTVCTRKCPVSAHVKENWRFVNKTRKVNKTLQDVKEKYEKNKAETEKKNNLLQTLQTEMENLETNKTRLLDEAYQHVENLEKIALNVVSLSTYVHLDFLIQEMEKRGDTEKVHKLKQMSSRADDRLRAGLKYIYRKFFKKKTDDKRGSEV
ncbi:uncharacterized protein [Enoplosus armatus]|uniref:uncharacterized protein n=1 Tax=Enoplosus armatus TaxID=215367 RepID=UPI0039940419